MVPTQNLVKRLRFGKDLSFKFISITLIVAISWMITSCGSRVVVNKPLTQSQIAEKLSNTPYPAGLDKTTISMLKEDPNFTSGVNQDLTSRLTDKKNENNSTIINGNIEILESFLAALSKESISQNPLFNELDLDYLILNPIYTSSDENISIYLFLSKQDDFRSYLVSSLKDYISSNKIQDKSYALSNLQYLESTAFESLYDATTINNAEVMREGPLQIIVGYDIMGGVVDFWIVVENLSDQITLLKLENVILSTNSATIKKRIDNNNYALEVILSSNDRKTYNYIFKLENPTKADRLSASFRLNDKSYNLKIR